MRSEPGSAAAWSVPLAPLGMLSAAALGLEVLLTKFLAYSVSAILVSVVLGIALLGFGAAGTLVAAYPDRLGRSAGKSGLAWASLAFTVTTLVVFSVFVRLSSLLHDFGVLTFVAALLLTSPFLSAGVVVALALATPDVGRSYAANLAGSAVGCVLPFVFLRTLGGEHMIPLLAAFGWGAAALFVRGSTKSTWLVRALAAVFGLVVACAVFARQLYSPLPEPAPLGQLEVVRAYAKERGIRETVHYDHWNPTGRIQIFGYDGVPDAPSPYPFLFYAQDSSAGSSLAKWDGRTRSEPASPGDDSEIPRACTETLWGQAYFAPRPRVLVIGLGGGMDVQCALYNGAASVDVVEINPDSIAAVRGPFDDWVGRIGENARVRYHLGDGRSFAHRSSHGGYDVIQLSGVDTKNSASSGGLALSENTLYTVEAFGDYLRNLSEDGVLSIVRFSDAEAVRLSNTAVTALGRMGISHPENHVVVRDNTYVRGLLIRKAPFSAAEVTALANEFPVSPSAPRPYGANIFFYSAMGMDFTSPPTLEYAPGRFGGGPTALYFAALAGGQERKFFELYPFDVSPATDDRPFFFDVFQYRSAALFSYPHVRALGGVMLSVLFIGLVLVLLPVLSSRIKVRGAPARATSFFVSIGLAYLFVEVWLIHRFGMYLGHQTYSLGVVLSALLLGTGVGSAQSKRFARVDKGIAFGALGILLLLAFGKAALPALLDETASAAFAARVALSVAYAALLGAFMGLPFPAGLTWAERRVPEAVPWYIGINGFSSVVATLAVIPVSHAFGYEALMLVGGALYVVAVGVTSSMRLAE